MGEKCKIKKSAVLPLVISFLLLPAYAEEELVKPLENMFSKALLPEVVQNWEYGINVDEDEKPRYFADILLPIYLGDIEDRTLFLEPRVNNAESEILLNFGLGYRQLVNDRKLLLGTNVFFDYDSHLSHYRLGSGLEVLGSHVELRANGYWGLSLARTVQTDNNTDIIEKAVDGYDLEFGVPIPFYNRLKIFGGYEWYDFKQFEDREGWQVRAEYKPFPFVVIDVTLSDSNKSVTSWGATIAFRPAFLDKTSQPIRSPFLLDSTPFHEGDEVGDRLFALVERHHEIVVEKYSQGQGQVSVEITRGS